LRNALSSTRLTVPGVPGILCAIYPGMLCAIYPGILSAVCPGICRGSHAWRSPCCAVPATEDYG